MDPLTANQKATIALGRQARVDHAHRAVGGEDRAFEALEFAGSTFTPEQRAAYQRRLDSPDPITAAGALAEIAHLRDQAQRDQVGQASAARGGYGSYNEYLAGVNTPGHRERAALTPREIIEPLG